MRTLLLGDTAPVYATKEAFRNKETDKLFTNVRDYMKDADYCFVNLECALTESTGNIKKFGPNLAAPIETADVLKEVGVDLCGLSNNHTFDLGVQGIKDTLSALDNAGIAYTGWGKNYEDSRTDYTVECDGQRITFITVCEHEYSYALENRMGARPYDEYDTMEDIRKAKAKADRVIVIYHGGKEYCRYPSPRLLKLCRAMAKNGADVVICQHSHCIGCYELYEGCHILYGQGNFHFVKYLDNETWNQGLMAQLDFDEETGKFDMKLIHVMAENTGIRLADEAEAEVILRQMRERDQKLLDGSWVDGWREFCESVRPGYEASVYNAQDDAENPRKKEHFAHYLDCEAHTDVYRELFATWHKKGINE